MGKALRPRASFLLLALLSLPSLVAPAIAQGAVLTHGPVVGAVAAQRARVFVRVDQQAEVRIEYSVDPDLGGSSLSPARVPTAGSDFTAILGLRDLEPETTYYLDVRVDGLRQLSAPYPSFTTFPAPGPPREFKFIVLTDFAKPDQISEQAPTFQSASLEDAAFVFIGGDFDHRNPKTLDAKRTVFKDMYDPALPIHWDFVELILRRMPIVHHWDDHDAGENNVDKTYPDWDLTHQAFTEYVPTYRLPSDPPGIWQRFRYAQADFLVLDNRSQRDPAGTPDGAGKSMLDGDDLGAAGQLEWLKRTLLRTSATWKFVFTSVVTNPTTKFTDGWAGYATEWSEIRAFIEDNQIGGVFFISGDLHSGGIDDGTQSGLPEMLVPSADGIKPGGGTCYTFSTPGEWSEGIYASETEPCRGYGVVSVLTDPDRLLVEVKNQDGGVEVQYVLFGSGD